MSSSETEKPRCQRKGGSRAPREAGISSVELVITMPALLIAVLTVLQIGLWMHARHVALAAAQDGLRVARAYDGSTAAAHERTVADLERLAPTILRDPTIEVTRDAGSAVVSVRGTATSILGIFALTVHEEAHGPIERFIPSTGGTR